MPEEYIPKAFISCSVRQEDKTFVEIVEQIVKDNGFEPMGTVGRHVNYAEPIPQSMIKEIKKADVLVMAATPRYFQKERPFQRKKQKVISEMLHVESGMAIMDNIPVIVFAKEGTHVGNFIPGITQYFTIGKTLVDEQREKIKIIFNDTKKKVANKIDKEEGNYWKYIIERILIVIGIIAIIRGMYKIIRKLIN